MHTDCLSKKSSEERIVSVTDPNRIELTNPDSYYHGSELQEKVKYYLN